MLTLTIPLRLVSVANLREHWAARSRRAHEQRAVTRMRLATERAWPPRLPVRVTITRIAPRVLDSDNLAMSAKAVRDGVADALGVDDGDAGVGWLYQQRKGRPGEYAVEIRVEELRDATA